MQALGGLFLCVKTDMKRAVQIGLAVFFAVGASLHFVLDDAFARIVPPVLPFALFIVWITGLAELAFSVALFVRYRLELTGIFLGLYMLAILPANIYMAIADVPVAGMHMPATVLWLRVALQIPFIWLVVWATRRRRAV